MTLTKTSLIAALLLGAGLATPALAERGPEGPGGPHPDLLEIFAEIDANGDGLLSLEELSAHRAARFAAADANGDGALVAEEVAAEMLKRMQEKLAERSQQMIENHDTDGDGKVTADEMGPGPAEMRFARIDTDNDGAISKEEAREAMKRLRRHGHGEGYGEGPDEEPME